MGKSSAIDKINRIKILVSKCNLSYLFFFFSPQGIGEPPLLLGASVHFALREAVNAARSDQGLSDNYKLACPATPEVIRMGCAGPIVKKVRYGLSNLHTEEHIV